MIIDIFEKISFTTGFSTNILLITPLVIALIFQISRSSQKHTIDAGYSRVRSERTYLTNKNKFAALFSVLFIIASGYVSYVVYQTKSLPRIYIEQK
jgi:hypothetical protein